MENESSQLQAHFRADATLPAVVVIRATLRLSIAHVNYTCPVRVTPARPDQERPSQPSLHRMIPNIPDEAANSARHFYVTPLFARPASDRPATGGHSSARLTRTKRSTHRARLPGHAPPP